MKRKERAMNVRNVGLAPAVATVLVLAAFFAATARADVFNLRGTRDPLTGTWTGLASLETVPVADPGNVGEAAGGSALVFDRPSRICGAVPYTYRMDKFEVTAGQYTEFLNAVAATDTYRLYNTDTWRISYGCRIQRSGSSGSYTYTVASAYANRPVNYVSWADAARFCNWLTNGQPRGSQNASTTENGVYALNGAMDIQTLMAVTTPDAATRAIWAAGTIPHWVLPSEDEWFKAAYYKGGSTNAGYWNYPTSNNTAPGRDTADPSGNNANINDNPNGGPSLIEPGHYFTEVGEFQNSAGPYGTFDQAGNVWEWIDDPVGNVTRFQRGGAYNYGDLYLQASLRARPPRPGRPGHPAEATQAAERDSGVEQVRQRAKQETNHANDNDNRGRDGGAGDGYLSGGDGPDARPLADQLEQLERSGAVVHRRRSGECGGYAVQPRV
ncbi:MAG: SUMF1/EgtB/PvdO family nonheme iron enzyme [Planctomycetota bacterium]|nr:SUMF1/EgtB/PvdO family nonheme iron enzyme [Planctomycetota bacterium]